jgi:small subunit ribosomal protein S21
MIKIDVKKTKNLDSALKIFKTKFEKTGIKKELLLRREFVKPSVVEREKISKAKYKEARRGDSEPS